MPSLLALALESCASTSPAASATTIASTTTTTTTLEPKILLPIGQLVAVPQQNREDPAKNQFQVQVVNDTDRRFDVLSVQFVWAGYTTPIMPRDSTVVGGQTIDFPVSFPGATCVGDGTIDTMPPLDGAMVLLGVGDGTILEVPVIDRWHLARRLYLDDCLRQQIESMVTIEWAELHEEEFDGRPVTAGVLRLTRLAGTSMITIQSVSGTWALTGRWDGFLVAEATRRSELASRR